MAKLNVALLGSGIFVREEHKPAVEACKNMNLVAVYSRSKASAETLLSADTLAEKAKSVVEQALGGTEKVGQAGVGVYSEETAGEGRGLKELLAREDVHVVIIA